MKRHLVTYLLLEAFFLLFMTMTVLNLMRYHKSILDRAKCRSIVVTQQPSAAKALDFYKHLY